MYACSKHIDLTREGQEGGGGGGFIGLLCRWGVYWATMQADTWLKTSEL